jgi:hypothetical protein
MRAVEEENSPNFYSAQRMQRRLKCDQLTSQVMAKAHMALGIGQVSCKS